ncbi:hypothetical protein [Clostridium intestinale]|uniref:hypothetical protein n=1 Tax=Clostridium intestinale TaxID=36845 RepID=UPI0028F12110|nr:hypothetical protein [Clostridium intestinale]
MYPESIDSFVEKLNKLDNNTYVIEEEVKPINGVYEGELKHDNISNSSLRVYTGSKLTGEKIENFILSTTSNTPWKKSIKIFSNSQKVYITYETQGDTVEAEDINILQESIVNTQIEIDRYKTSNDNEVLNLKNRATSLENGKAAKTYVDTELAKKMDKTSAYTKTETDQRIQNVVGAAPAALDTLKELADALGNDANFAGTMTSALSNKVDKVSGKQLSTEDYTTTEKSKLAGVAASANNYVHPSTHAATVITEDTTHRFITDIDKTNWNDANTKKHTHSNKSIIDAITQTLIDTWNSAYSHISDVVKHITDDERTLWNTIVSKVDKVEGKQLSTEDYTTTEKSKLEGIAASANNYVHPSTHAATIIVEDSTHRFATDTEKANWNDANSKKHTHSNKSIIDAITQTLIDTWNSAYSHISDVVKHITDDERTLWNTVANKVDKETGKVLSSNDFTSAYKSKVDGITTGATKVESSSTNGNIKINGTEKAVYTHPANHDDRYYTESEADTRFAIKADLDAVYIRKGVVTWNDLKGV